MLVYTYMTYNYSSGYTCLMASNRNRRWKLMFSNRTARGLFIEMHAANNSELFIKSEPWLKPLRHTDDTSRVFPLQSNTWRHMWTVYIDFMGCFWVITCIHKLGQYCDDMHQGVIQDFEVEGGNEKSNQKMLLKKGQLLFQYPAMDTQS